MKRFTLVRVTRGGSDKGSIDDFQSVAEAQRFVEASYGTQRWAELVPGIWGCDVGRHTYTIHPSRSALPEVTKLERRMEAR